MFIIYESYFIIWLAVEIEKRKSFLRIVMQMEACVDCDMDFACHVDIIFQYKLVDYAHIMTSFKYLRVSIVPLKVSCIVFSIASIILWYIFSCECINWVTWRMLAPCYDYSLVTLSLYEHLVFDLLYQFML